MANGNFTEMSRHQLWNKNNYCQRYITVIKTDICTRTLYNQRKRRKWSLTEEYYLF